MCVCINKVCSLPFPFVIYPSEKKKKYDLLNTSQGEGAYNVVDDTIIFLYLFSLCEAVTMKSRPWPHAGS